MGFAPMLSPSSGKEEGAGRGKGLGGDDIHTVEAADSVMSYPLFRPLVSLRRPRPAFALAKACALDRRSIGRSEGDSTVHQARL